MPPRLPKHRGQLLFLQRRGRRGRLYERGFLSNGPTEPLLPPKMTMEMGVHRVRDCSDGAASYDDPGDC